MNAYASSAETIGAFIKSFGKEDLHDINNGVYLATQLLNLKIPFEFRSKGRFGVVSFELCSILDLAKQTPQSDDQSIHKIGNILSKYNSKELMCMALYLKNKARLYPEEIEEAKKLLNSISK